MKLNDRHLFPIIMDKRKNANKLLKTVKAKDESQIERL
jgi:hypothetical protein